MVKVDERGFKWVCLHQMKSQSLIRNKRTVLSNKNKKKR